MTTTYADSRCWKLDLLVLSGTPEIHAIPDTYGGEKLGVMGKPGGGGTIKVEYTLSSGADVQAGTAVWETWTAGTSAAAATERLQLPIRFVRLTAAVANATVALVL